MTIHRTVLMYLIFVLYSVQAFSGVIGIFIFPEDIQKIHKEEDGKCYEFFKVQIQFFKPNQVSLVSTKDKPQFKYGTIVDTKESPEAWQQLIEKGTQVAYQLSWHKQFKNIAADDELKIFIHQGNHFFKNSSMPKDVLNNIFKFMMLDQQSNQLSCYEFVRETKFNFIEGCGSENENYNLYSQLEYRDDESRFSPGDAVICYHINENRMHAKHFALALGDNMYIAKNGYGGLLTISDLNTMLDFWGCNHCAKIKQEALENRYIWRILEAHLEKDPVEEHS